ncbi:hypothetical protein LX64_01757 [Chitinophaga skermanii]|uniref:Uncharacterized protein n=1 Tax=Chitinophaga skermanii TaxID=331697 RepID=A0A327QQL3_9BACT|nr:DUF5691 domain-containing protein [Chitinophaga skermanii]RAJ06630.1 hypothetical protein LX64_01757 [Chitinophaga skermanii]
MQHWNNLVQTAMLGTGKKTISDTDVPSALQAANTLVLQTSSLDKEEQFLQVSALALNYKQAGVQPLHKENILVTIAPSETLPYSNAASSTALTYVLHDQTVALLRYWLEKCKAANAIIPLVHLAGVLEEGKQHKSIRSLVRATAGNRAKWLAEMNTDWSYILKEETTSWDDASLDDRVALIAALHKEKPEEAILLLQSTWKGEDANSKFNLLQALDSSLHACDVEFITAALQEKSKKVKELASEYLLRIPSSPNIQRIVSLITKCFTLSSDGKKINIALTDEVIQALVETGQKVSTDPKDHFYMIEALLRMTPPVELSNYLQVTPTRLLELIEKHAHSSTYKQAIQDALDTFYDATWFEAVATFFPHKFYEEMLTIYDKPTFDAYVLPFLRKQLTNDMPRLVRFMSDVYPYEWSQAMGEEILKYTSKNGYEYNTPYYANAIDKIPASLVPYIAQLEPTDNYGGYYWKNVAVKLQSLLSRKQKINEAFHQ